VVRRQEQRRHLHFHGVNKFRVESHFSNNSHISGTTKHVALRLVLLGILKTKNFSIDFYQKT